ncbi:RNA methyltransferase [Desulfovibrio mangrovi]|uniref:RNA methyltransferase n=1 Tax=Desulfovibrio mangrovi TaxID=2976983 RepID=UPI0022479C54|nr:RNA methyltransferase [Desulfovibrio mangrovi]UZP66036.1 RNA methyltransferase [Desulfovibrio mangrovi]
MLDNLAVVLVKPRFPENIGMAARACVNMGVNELVVVQPERWDMDRIHSLATIKGADLVRSIRVEDDLAKALAGYTQVYGTTARTGGWRSEILSPEKAAPLISGQLAGGGKVALLFGPEDKGLTNEETEICNHLLTIPVNPQASSLNLAQAVLIVLYECFKVGARAPLMSVASDAQSPLCTHAEQEMVIRTLRDTLLRIDFLRKNNPDYFMLPVRRFLQKIALRRHEFSMLMGICNQIGWVADKAGLPKCQDRGGTDSDSAPRD